MTTANAVEQWRAAYDERRWADAVACLDRVEVPSLGADELERAATAMWLAGRGDRAMDLLTLAHRLHREAGDSAGAARTATWLSIGLVDLGELARSGGWAARALDVADELPDSDPERALVILPTALKALFDGRVDDADEGFRTARAIAKESRGGDALALACLGSGQSRIMRGDIDDGMALFDEAMVAVTAGEVSLVACGIIYCSVISFCKLAWDLKRASEWTSALDRWCASQSTMVAYQGQCEANRADLMRLHGRWDEALACAESARRRLENGDQGAGFSAPYQRAEVLRLRGRFDEADEGYRLAGETGWPPQPGLALLRLAQGRPADARTMLRRTLEASDPATRSTLLPALVEAELAAGDVDAAHAVADELGDLNDALGTPLIDATAALAAGRVLRAEGDVSGAITRLQQALVGWSGLDAPYHAARCRAELARAYADAGDLRAATEERERACRAFAQLGAQPALEWCERDAGAAGDLSRRELEVLRLVATGMTNRQVATELTLSEKTVARHLENIYAKLEVSSRSAATAWAFEHGIV